MKNLFLLVFIFLYAGGERFLSDIHLYQKESYFKQKVYAEHDWKSFYGLMEANQVIDPDNYDLHLLNAAVFFATNKVREDKRLKPLKFSTELRDAAVVHSQQMVEKKFFDHFNNKIRKLRSPENRMILFGVEATAMGENIDYNNIDMPSRITYLQLADKIVDAWMHSAPQRTPKRPREYPGPRTWGARTK